MTNTSIQSTNSSFTVTSGAGSRSEPHNYVGNYDRDNGHVPLDKRQLPQRTKMVLHMQLRGFRQAEIAETLGLRPTHVSRICRSKRYLAAFDAKIDEVDGEFLRLKPKAIRALDSALCSRDEGLGLRAAETWFKAHGYRGFGPQGNASGVTINVMAEDVAIQLLNNATRRREAAAAPTASADAAQGQETSP